MSSFDVVVIGEGVCGLTAAQALAKAGLRTATVEGQLFGGLVININELEPGPGGRHTSGAEFASEIMAANSELGVESIQSPVSEIRDQGAMKEIVTEGGTYKARAVLIASGAKMRKLGVPGEAEFEGRGVSQCGDCDGPMFQNETVIVVGGGDSAMQEALSLAQYCGAVQVVHRGSAFKGQQHLMDRVKAEPKISVTWNATVTSITGKDMVQGAVVKHADGRTEERACAGVFVFVGLEPNSGFAPVKKDAAGYIETNDRYQTSVAGIYAAGAVRSGHGGLLDDAIREADAAAAAIGTSLT